MGLLGSLASGVKTAVQRSATGSDVGAQVRAQYEEVMERINSKTVEVPKEYERRLAPVFAACLTEVRMLTSVELLLEQLQADGHRAMPVEVRIKIIETIRDIKMTSLEADGCVNPLDRASIQIAATALKPKARAYLMSARMAGAKSISAMLDMVELRLIDDATKQYGHDYAKWQRAAQSAIWAVAELRQQQLVN